MSIRLGIWAPVQGRFLAGRQPPEEVVEADWGYVAPLVQRADALGFDTVLILDHLMNPAKGFNCPNLEAITTTAALAPITRRIELMVAYRALTRHPAVLAKEGANIDHISGGRFAVNIVSGWHEEEFVRFGLPFPPHDERHAISVEAAEIMRGMWTHEYFSYQGRYFRVQEAPVVPRPVRQPHPHIYFGGESPGGKLAAARVADVYLQNGRPVEEAAAAVQEVNALAAERGRRVDHGISAFVICRDSEAEADAELGRLLAVTGGVSVRLGRIDAEVQHIKSGAKSRGVGTNGGINAGLVGTPAQIVERLRAFHAAGIELFLLQFHPAREELERFARDVLPLLQPELAAAG